MTCKRGHDSPRDTQRHCIACKHEKYAQDAAAKKGKVVALSRSLIRIKSERPAGKRKDYIGIFIRETCGQ
jgi:hypothetical protein